MSEGFLAVMSAIRGETDPATLLHPLFLPALVGDFSYTEEGGHNDYDTVGAGQFSQPQGRKGVNAAKKLQTVPLNLYCSWYPLPFLPAPPPGVPELPPQQVLGQLLDIIRARRAVDLKVWREGDEAAMVNMSVTLRTITPTVKGGEAATIYVTVEAKEWRDPSVSRATSSVSRKGGVGLPTTHQLSATDTWASLAHDYYGNGSLWRPIAEANGSSWGQNTKLAAATPPLTTGVLAAPAPYAIGASVIIPAKPASASVPLITAERSQRSTRGVGAG